MRACLVLLTLGLALVLLPRATLAQEAAVAYVPASARQSDAVEQGKLRGARAGMALSALGIVISTAGIIAGGLLLAPSRYACQGDVCGLGRPEQALPAGKALVVISPITLGASIFGLVRSKRKLDRLYGKEQTEPRNRASWRAVRN